MSLTSTNNIQSVAIIGAGMAGISCAIALNKAIPKLQVFERADSAGGRMSTRQAAVFQFDCGAQYFTARTPEFKRLISSWEESWLADEWQAWIVDLYQGNALSREDDVKRYVGRPNMQAVVEDMASLCDVRYKTNVMRLAAVDKAWELFDQNDQSLGLFDAVLVAVPAPQAQTLLSTAVPALAEQAQSVTMVPCWALMVVFDRPLNLGFDAAFMVEPKLAWAARDSSKPERGEQSLAGEEAWVLHASPEWSEQNQSLSHAEVAEALLEEFANATQQVLPQPDYTDCKYWSQAMVVNGLSEGYLYDPQQRIGACGDWCHSSRVEGAFQSGISLAARLLQAESSP